MEDMPVALAAGYANQVDWDPRTVGGHHVCIVLRPDRTQTWREVNEMEGKTLMHAGAWVVWVRRSLRERRTILGNGGYVATDGQRSDGYGWCRCRCGAGKRWRGASRQAGLTGRAVWRRHWRVKASQAWSHRALQCVLRSASGGLTCRRGQCMPLPRVKIWLQRQ